jgi:hypothetical protein
VSLLSMFQRVCNEVGLPEPTLVVTSTDRQVKQLLATTYRVGNDVKSADWNKLEREATITLVDGQENYALPADYDVELSETEWDSTNDWPLIGPLSPSEWQALKNNTISSSEFERKFRIKGTALKTFYIDPIPDSTNAGDVLLFEYLSQNWIRPKTWTTGAVFTAGSYCFYDGVYFSTVAGGTTGATAPTALALNDGGVTWVVSTAVYSFTADTDEFILDEDLIGLGVQWNYLASKGLPYAHLEKKYNNDIAFLMAQNAGTETISLVPKHGLFSNGYRNYRVIP